LFGGTVTTLRAGMAEDGWLRPDGHFLWLYPLDLRVRDLGTFVEHHHREFGSLVGLLAIASAIAAWRCERRALTRWLPSIGLLAVCVQGAIGGFRVLENSPALAFLHGALAQAVFALLVAIALVLSPAFQAARSKAGAATSALARLAFTTTVAVYAQIVLGAWFRHSGADIALALHVLIAVAVLGLVTALARALRATDADGERSPLHVVGRRIRWLVIAQIALGCLATFMIYEQSGGPQGRVSVGEAVFATLHVLVGALLLSQVVCAALWSRRAPSTVAAGLETSGDAIAIPAESRLGVVR
jgi:cytochrome c oxidase assembly protein subunit 15